MFEEQQNTEKINDNVNEEEILLDDLNGPNSGDDIEDIFAGTDNENLFDANESVSSAFSNEEELDILGLDSSSLDNGFLKLTNTTIRL